MNALLLTTLIALSVVVVAAGVMFRLLKRTESAIRIADGRFLLAFSGLLAHIAMADGEVSADEVSTVERMFEGMSLSRAERAMCVGNFLLAQRESGKTVELAQELSASFNHVACQLLYGLVWRVANADGRVSVEEEALLKVIGETFGLTVSEQEAFRRGVPPVLDRLALADAGVPSALARFWLQGGAEKGRR